MQWSNSNFWSSIYTFDLSHSFLLTHSCYWKDHSMWCVCLSLTSFIHSLVHWIHFYWESTMCKIFIENPLWASFVAQLGKNPPPIRETWVFFPGLERSPGEGKGYPLQYSGLENSMDYVVHGVTKSWTRLSDFHLHFTMCRNVGIYTWRLHDPFQVKVSYFEIPVII